MEKLHYISISAQDNTYHDTFRNLMIPYAAELDEHYHRATPRDVINRWIDSILSLQDEQGRHLELAYSDDTLVGFLYGKIDRPEHKGYTKIGFGYMMEFYILPKYRRRGYGRLMFKRLEKLLVNDGAKCLYLTADPVTGKPFWKSLGFIATGEISPENGQEIYEKSIGENNPTIQIMKHPDDTVIYAIAKHHGAIADKVVRGLNKIISEAHKHSDYFAAVMMQDEEVIGFASFIQSRFDGHTWLYTDLWVMPQHRRQGYATAVVRAGIQHLFTLGAKRVLCSVDPDNTPSLLLQQSLGFKEIAVEAFEGFETEGLLMLQMEITKP